MPRRVFDFLTALGVAVAVVLLRGPRRNSRCYLTAILGRPPTLREIWRHYLEFFTMHMLRLRVAAGRTHRCHPLPGCQAFIALMESGRPALLGSFHIGNSDLLGFFLGQFRHPVYMVRFRLGDPLFLRKIADKFSAWVSFIWVNEKEDLLFALKHAAQSEGSIAMKCDRVDFSAKLETFDFLGARRSFPFTIYHLGILFQRPVAFCVSSPAGPDESAVHGFPVFEPDSGSKKMNLDRARAHFQLVLTGIESLLRAKPYLWFNFALFHPAATVAHSPIMSPRPATPLSRLPDVA